MCGEQRLSEMVGRCEAPGSTRSGGWRYVHVHETKLLHTQSRRCEFRGEKGEAENILSGTLKSLFAISEAYPELKANTNFMELQRELSDTENKIMASRRFYNGNVRDFNTKLQVFPTNMIAGMLKFTAREFFEMDEKEKENVKVEF
jgi:LemA protein